jgi:uncharacterized membrane protein
MDYDYVNFLYNNGNGTCEWTYDSILAFKNRPWHGRIYILPIIGLAHVDHANEYFICDLVIKREDGVLSLDYHLTSSYEAVAQVTLNAEVEYALLSDTPQRQRLPSITLDGIGIQPTRGHVETALDATDPLVLNISAFTELPDGTTKKFEFQHFYIGEYGMGKNIRREGKPVKLLRRDVQKPLVPEAPAGLAIDRAHNRVFGVFGLGSERTGVRQAILDIPEVTLDIGYCTGRDSYGYGLGDFPYDYERLFQYRVLVFSNVQDKEFRRIGASILLPWLEAGGGLVICGGENAFTFELEEHDITQYYPVAPVQRTLRRGPLQLQAPPRPDHPIFAGVDLSALPYLYYYHDIALKPDAPATVLMSVGDKPFIVEQRRGKQLTVVVAANGFGAATEFDDKPGLREWSEWPKLFANIIRYAAAER